MELFGFKIVRKKDPEVNIPKTVTSFASKENEDAAISTAEGQFYNYTFNADSDVKSESKLIEKYIEISLQSECEKAVDDVVNEAIVCDLNEMPVKVVLDKVKNIPDNIKKRIAEEFTDILTLLKFNTNAYDIFRKWYVTGRVYYHIMIDEANTKNGIQELRYIDPRKIKKVRSKKRNKQGPVQTGQKFTPPVYEEYFIYSEKGVSDATTGVKVSPDSIAFCHSGITNPQNTMILSHLQKAIKPLNQLRSLEDATVVYQLARAPERRIFYIDVGNLPKAKAEQYLRDMMIKHKNKLVYDVNTGDVKDERKVMTMLEDYWLPRRDGKGGTEITTLPAGNNTTLIDALTYFKRKLYESLNVPISRLDSEAIFSLGKSSEITRDEIKFAKFVGRLRMRFSELFNILLEKQLLLKQVITEQEWLDMKNLIFYDFVEDNHFSELKQAELLQGRLALLEQSDMYQGKYFSINWIKKNILRQTDEEIEEIEEEMLGDPPPMEEIQMAGEAAKNKLKINSKKNK